MNPVTDLAGDPSALLLVRRVSTDAGGLTGMSGSGPAAEQDLARRAATGGLFVLADLAAEPGCAPKATAVFDWEGDSGRARLVLFSIESPEDQAGIGRRLLEGALMLLRSYGVELIEANTDERFSPLLEKLGFRQDYGAKLLYWL